METFKKSERYRHIVLTFLLGILLPTLICFGMSRHFKALWPFLIALIFIISSSVLIGKNILEIVTCDNVFMDKKTYFKGISIKCLFIALGLILAYIVVYLIFTLAFKMDLKNFTFSSIYDLFLLYVTLRYLLIYIVLALLIIVSLVGLYGKMFFYLGVGSNLSFPRLFKESFVSFDRPALAVVISFAASFILGAVLLCSVFIILKFALFMNVALLFLIFALLVTVFFTVDFIWDFLLLKFC